MVSKKQTTKTEDAATIVASSWKIPALSTRLHNINMDALNRKPDILDKQLIALRTEKGPTLYKVNYVSSHNIDGDDSARIDMVIATELTGDVSKTLTYWTDFDEEVIIPRACNSDRLFTEDLLSPTIVVVGGDTTITQQSAIEAAVSFSAKHSWPALKSDQKNIVRMEATTNGDWKFWSVWSVGNAVHYYHGRIGEPNGYSGQYNIASVRMAGGSAKFMDKKIREKLNKGYVKV